MSGRAHMPPCKPFAVSVPASSANLGPGFDAVGIALDLRLSARVRPASRIRLTFGGNEAPSHDGYEAVLLRAMQRVDPELPNVAMHVDNPIPLGKGLGSSAAASVLGLIVALRARGRRVDREYVAREASALEGHPDNALAAVYGGAIVAASACPSECVRLGAPAGLSAIVVVPEIELSTESARAILPERYDRGDVVFTAQRASLLGAALGSGSWRALRAAMRDRLHQPYRAQCVPGLEGALRVEGRDLIGIALSGAGPSVLAIVRSGNGAGRLGSQIEAQFKRAGVPARTYRLAFAARGAGAWGLTA
jgi:homoserine kinase